MCFSSQASFAGGIIITAIGVVTVRKVHEPSQIIFGSIPLFFAAQQIAEGFLWLTLPDPDLIHLQKSCIYIFMISAQVIWPLMIPLSVLMMEKNSIRKKFLKVLLICGFSVSVYYAVCQLFLNITARISGYHILYTTDFPESVSLPVFIVYLVATITPLFVSTVKRTWIMGILMMASCMVTAIFYRQYLTSVWCFFAALLSGVIFWILRDSEKAYVVVASDNLLTV